MASVKPERQGLCSRVVCVLHEFLQDREAAPVAIAQIDRNLIDVVGGESSHFLRPPQSFRLRMDIFRPGDKIARLEFDK